MKIFLSKTRSRDDDELNIAKHYVNYEIPCEDGGSVDTSSISCSFQEIKDGYPHNSIISCEDGESVDTSSISRSFQEIKDGYPRDSIISALKSPNFSSTPSSFKKPKSVRFSTIEIREYPICIGDNPAVTAGPPLTIAWDYQCECEFNIQDYEADRPPRREKVEMQIGSADRFVMLKSCGYSRKEIVTVLKKTDIARQRRQRAGELSLFAVVQESFEYYKRAIANATIRRGTKQRERALLAEYKKPT